LEAHACVPSPAVKKKRQSMFGGAVARYSALARLRSSVVLICGRVGKKIGRL
jgi:hypothetical protein